MNLVELAESAIEASGEHVSIIFQGREITNVEMSRASRKLASALHGLGVRRGDRVLIQMPNSPEVLQSFAAIWRIGAIAVPVNHMIGAEESAFIYRDSGAASLISSSALLPRLKSCLANAPSVRNVVLTGDPVPEGFYSCAALAADGPEMTGTGVQEEGDAAAIVYTAGTTGRPKGAVHTHRSLYWAGKMLADSVPVPEGNTSVFVLPLCHVYGIGCMVGLFFQKRGRGIILPSATVDGIFESIQKYRANLFTGVPTMYVYMLLHPDPGKYDLSSMRRWVSGSAALLQDTWLGFKERFGYEIIEGWGLTETGACGCISPADGQKKPGSIGRRTPGAEIRIVDDRGQEVAPGLQGEILIRTPSMMQGYWGKPEETAAVLADGWLSTGDMGYIDEDGYYFITDRKKDIIIKGGENISPREIEDVIMGHPAVSEAAVVGLADATYGEQICAFVVARPGAPVQPQELRDYCHARLGSFKTPKRYTLVETLPRNLVGKVLRKELRKMAEERQQNGL